MGQLLPEANRSYCLAILFILIFIEGIKSPRHCGDLQLTPEDINTGKQRIVRASAGGASCGDEISLSLLVEQASGLVLDAKFRSFGCGSCLVQPEL